MPFKSMNENGKFSYSNNHEPMHSLTALHATRGAISIVDIPRWIGIERHMLSL